MENGEWRMENGKFSCVVKLVFLSYEAKIVELI